MTINQFLEVETSFATTKSSVCKLVWGERSSKLKLNSTQAYQHIVLQEKYHYIFQHSSDFSSYKASN